MLVISISGGDDHHHIPLQPPRTQKQMQSIRFVHEVT
jgi:hypothetical protein